MPRGSLPSISFWEPSELADAFVKMSYDTNCILAGFDWLEWLKSDEASSLLKDHSAVTEAGPEQLQKLVTAFVRSDRFCEGTVLQAFSDGTLQAIACIAVTLLK